MSNFSQLFFIFKVPPSYCVLQYFPPILGKKSSHFGEKILPIYPNLKIDPSIGQSLINEVSELSRVPAHLAMTYHQVFIFVYPSFFSSPKILHLSGLTFSTFISLNLLVSISLEFYTIINDLLCDIYDLR